MLTRICLTMAGATLACAGPCAAQDLATDDHTTALDGRAPAPALEQVDLPVPEALTDEELGDLRGGETMIISNQTLVAITTGNVINGNYVAGNVSLSDFSLSNFNGLGNVLINTGAQVSLQTGMNVTINVGD